MWGVRREPVSYGTGHYDEVSYHPMASFAQVDEVHAYPWPDPDDFDYGVIREALSADDRYRVIRAGGYEPFLLYCSLRGLEQGFEDLLLATDIVEAILGHLFEFFYEHNRRVFEAGEGRIDITYLAEDLGSQSGPLISLDCYRRFLLPNQKKMADLAHSHGIRVMYHTDGAARVFLPDLIEEVGIDILNPIQWRCAGMEREGLVRDFGERITFHGAMDNQQTLSFGSVDDVVAEVADNVRIFHGASWICAPCHNIQAVSPTANIVALYDAIHRIGRASPS